MRLRALVADDDPEMLDMVARALENFGADVVRASSGDELLEHIAEAGTFDVVVTDISMPWMTWTRSANTGSSASCRAAPIPRASMTRTRTSTST